ncbi:MAG: zinc ribbon domain-containing protein [Clostridia bacterium]|nr:zinc ribbon domain-containing protein [Clostridia bacterium]MBR6290092.1 zinc ribbon domain-containing protein [Clostridia bacterium]
MADFNDKLNEMNNTKDYTAEYDKNDIEQNKVMAILAYLGWLVLIPLFAAKESKYARFHVNQGLILAIVETVIMIVLSILTLIPVIRWIFYIVEAVAGIVFLVMWIIGIMNAANGRAKELPVIGSFRLLK